MTGMGAITGLMTFEEFERLPEDEQGYTLELLDGELIRMPPADHAHAKISHRLRDLLKDALARYHSSGESGHLGEAFVEIGYRVGANWIIPDVSITHSGQAGGKYLEGAPALAVEVISESNHAGEMHRKVRRLLANGSHEVWLLYPDTQSVTIYRGNTSIEIEGTLTSELLPGLSINLSEIIP